MIKMISSAKISSIESKSDFQSESEEPEKQDFAEILNGFAFAAIPFVQQMQPASLENSGGTSAEKGNISSFSEETKQSLPQFDEGLVLPKDFAQILPENFLENVQLNSAQTTETAKNSLASTSDFAANFSKTEILSSEKIELVSENEKAENSDLFSHIENLDLEAAAPQKEIGEANIFGNQNSAENFAGERNNQSANKLPKLFREVSSFLETYDFSSKTTQTAENIAPTNISEANVPAQIEAQIEHLASLAIQIGKPQILKMRLNPAELGAVEIKIEKDSVGNLNAHFQTESEETRQILTDNLAELRDRLEDSGLQLERIEISCGSFAFAGSEAREDASQAFENRFPVANTKLPPESNPIVKDDANSEKSNRLLSIRA